MASGTTARDGWTRVRFGEIAEQINDRVDDPNAAGVDRYVGLEHLDPGSLRVTRWGSPDEVSAQKLRFHPGDIIFGKRRAYQRKVAVADFEGICSAHAMVIREREGLLAPGFLIHCMASDTFMDRAVQISVGSLSPTINWSALRDQEFKVPPLEEQQRILVFLGNFANVERRLAEMAKAAAELRDSLRAEMSASTKRRKKLNQLLSFITSGSRGWSRYYADDGHVFLRIANLNGPTLALNMADTQRVRAPQDAESARTQVQQNDVLLGITGEAGVGLVGIVRDYERPTFISQHVALIRLVDKECCPEFIAHALAGPLGQRQIARFNQAGAKAGMTLVAVRDLEVPDLPLCEQQEWANRLFAVEQTMQDIANRVRTASMQNQWALNRCLAEVGT